MGISPPCIKGTKKSRLGQGIFSARTHTKITKEQRTQRGKRGFFQLISATSGCRNGDQEGNLRPTGSVEVQ